nr:phage replisome organizer N-terminal domain-containing protein [Enterococcus sp. 665A]
MKENFFEEDTIEWLEEQPNGKEYCLFYLKLCLKSLKTEGLLVRNVGNLMIPYDPESLAKLTNSKLDTVKVAMDLFNKIGLIQIMDSGEIYLNQLGEMVGSETEYARQKRLQRSKDDNVQKLSGKGRLELEIELEKELEIELDKNTPSKKKKAPAFNHKLGEYKNVGFTDDQLAKLKEEFPNDWEQRIEKVSSYCASSGKTYKNYLATIRNWDRKDAESNSKALKTNTRASYGNKKPRNENHTRMLAMYFQKEKKFNPDLTMEEYASKKKLSDQDVMEIKQLIAKQEGNK